MKAIVGDDAALGLLRVLGATMARLAEAGCDGDSRRTTRHPDRPTPRTSSPRRRRIALSAEFIPRIAKLIDAVFRHHTISARTYFEGVIRDSSASVLCGVGFADLSGFTALTQRLTPAELSSLLGEFNAAVTDVVHADGGRVVKFIGDEVMWVSSTPEQLAKVAIDLVEHPRAREAGLQVRAGLGYGRVLAIGRRLLRHRGQPGGPPGGRRGTRADPRRRRTSATSCPTGPPFRRIR